MTIRKAIGFLVALLIIGRLAYKPVLRALHRTSVEVYIEGWHMIEGEAVAQIRIENNTPDPLQYDLLLEPPYLVEHIKEILAQLDKPITCLTGMMPRMPYGTLASGEAISVSIPAWWLDATTANRPWFVHQGFDGGEEYMG